MRLRAIFTWGFKEFLMVFPLTEEQQMIRDNVMRICADFGDDYWLARDEDGVFPEDFCT